MEPEPEQRKRDRLLSSPTGCTPRQGASDQDPGFQWRLRKCVGLQTDLDNIGKVERVRALQESL